MKKQKKPQNNYKVALVCEWLTEDGGAERVIENFHELFPKAPIYTSQYRKKRTPWLKDADVRTGKLNKYPVWSRRFIAKKRQKYFKRLDLTRYDRVISITGSDAKLVNHVNHICYCHVPTQYYWGKHEEYLKNPGFGILNPLARRTLKKDLETLRDYDFIGAKNIKEFVTISDFAKKEIKKYYNREAKVIYPPVNTAFFAQGVEKYKTKTAKSQTNKSNNKTIKNQISQARKTEQVFCSPLKEVKNLWLLTELISKYPDGFYLNFSRQVNWKNLDLVVEACKELNLPLVLVGDGPENKKLRKLAKKSDNITFVGSLPQSDLRTILELSRAFVFPSAEPFGIAPVEALASGTPVIALKKGGATDYIKDGVNGIFFKNPSKASLKKALKDFEKLRQKSPRKAIFDRKKVSKTAERFSVERFKKEILELTK